MALPPFTLKDRVALVTGASKGIGAATAELLASFGARVAVAYRGDREGAERFLTGEILNANGGAVLVG